MAYSLLISVLLVSVAMTYSLPSTFETCWDCRDTFLVVHSVVDNPLIRDYVFEWVGTLLCKSLITKVYSDNSLCQGVIKLMTPSFISSLKDSYLDPDFACGSPMFNKCHYPDFEVLSLTDYQKKVLSSKPPQYQDNNFVDQLYKTIGGDNTKRDTLRMVHISDLHLDTKYTPDSEADCGLPVCCRDAKGVVKLPAGFYGSYNCDLPQNTLEDMLAFISNDIKPDIVLWTGDNVPHDIWEETKTEVSNANVKSA